MLLRIAHRLNGRTTVQCDIKGQNYFVVGAFYDYSYLDDEKTLVLSTGHERTGALCSDASGCYRRSGMERAISFTCLPDWLPAFQVHSAEYDLVDEMIVWQRPPVWALHWTVQGPRTDRVAVARYGFEVRLASAKRNRIPLSEVTKNVPEWALSVIGTDTWCALVKKYALRLNADPVDARL